MLAEAEPVAALELAPKVEPVARLVAELDVAALEEPDFAVLAEPCFAFVVASAACSVGLGAAEAFRWHTEFDLVE